MNLNLPAENPYSPKHSCTDLIDHYPTKQPTHPNRGRGGELCVGLRVRGRLHEPAHQLLLRVPHPGQGGWVHTHARADRRKSVHTYIYRSNKPSRPHAHTHASQRGPSGLFTELPPSPEASAVPAATGSPLATGHDNGENNAGGLADQEVCVGQRKRRVDLTRD